MNTLYPAPRKFSYNIACDVLEKAFNPNYHALDGLNSVFTIKHVNADVTFFYIGDELVAVYDENSGDLWGAWEKRVALA